MKRRRFGLSAVAALAVIVVSACETGPVYRPRGPNDVVGYSDEHIAGNRYRITFSGNYSTRREDVEDNLMRRAAEVTLQAGYTHFSFDNRNTEAETYYRMDFDPYDRWPYWGYGYGYGYGRPYYWSSWDYNGEARPITRYNAYAEILVLTPEQAQNDVHAVAAADVLGRLQPLPPSSPPSASN